jgi:hypothetical protein
MNKREFLLPPEGVAKGCDPFSLREKAGMRGYKNQSVSFSDPLTLTLSRGGEGTFATPSGGRESSVVT